MKLEFPKLSEVTPSAINNWLGRCEDTYEAWQTLNVDKILEPKLLITLAGLHMEEETAASWWNENQMSLKVCTSWEAFGTRVRKHFVPVNWKLVALTSFYTIHQGSSPFPSFVSQLQNARNALASAGNGYVINDAIMKNHPGFGYEKLKLNRLIGTMALEWECLVAECIVKVPTGVPASSICVYSNVEL
ncbi:hypothetical protein B0H12DRAFT_1075643 [Mycena haematopus]|nr:hypothetical protein B0H12DRAFT_1075643 [Mycena haematopus]